MQNLCLAYIKQNLANASSDILGH